MGDAMLCCRWRGEEEREPGAPEFIGGCVLLLYRYIIIANFFFLFSVFNGVSGRGHLVFSLSPALLFLFSGGGVEGMGGLYTYLDCLFASRYPPTRRVLGYDNVRRGYT